MSIKRKVSAVLLILLATIGCVNLFGAQAARTFPGLYTYFSMNDGPFGWKYVYDEGEFDGLVVGCKIDTCLSVIEAKPHAEYVPSQPQMPGVLASERDFRRTVYAQLSKSPALSQLTFSYSNYGTPILIVLNLVEGKVASIEASGYVFAGL
ncbi:MAG: hypothetical protein ACTHJQ_25535 [Rhizobiaceae bacterium]